MEQALPKKALITHIINGLHTGGAEMMLYKLLSAMDRKRFDARVITLIDGGDIRAKIEDLGIEVHSLGISRSSPNLAGAARLVRYLHQHPPDLIQTWMYHADLLGGVVGKLFTSAPIVWNVQTADSAYHPDNKRTLWIIKLCAWLSSMVPQYVISCSQVACKIHTEIGYAKSRLLPIPNGADLASFQPDETARTAFRAELNLPDTTMLVGMVARFHPQKDHQNFVRAAARLHQIMPEVHFVLCGDEVTGANDTLSQWIQEGGLVNHCHLLGRRKDTPRINAALDVATLSSAYGEGFPNVLVEALACGVPCVATDSGDSALIVEGVGISVPVCAPDALASGWEALLKMSAEEKAKLRQAARQRVVEKYALPSVVAQYEGVYKKLLGIE
ncbi:MAG: glycosyltransferase [Blastocatellia bacterium]